MSRLISTVSPFLALFLISLHQHECVSAEAQADSATHQSRPKGTIDPRVITYPGKCCVCV